MNPKKTLSRTDREAHGIKTSADILKLVRTPGPGMTTFDTKTLSDRDAKLIAEYVLKTFTK
jgi:cytochrome c6